MCSEERRDINWEGNEIIRIGQRVNSRLNCLEKVFGELGKKKKKLRTNGTRAGKATIPKGHTVENREHVEGPTKGKESIRVQQFPNFLEGCWLEQIVHTYIQCDGGLEKCTCAHA